MNGAIVNALPTSGSRQPADVLIRWDQRQACFVLSVATAVARPRTEVFDFFSDASQLERITPEWLNFRILTPQPISISRGTLIDYRIRLHGLPIRWRTEISEWNPPYSFVDRQVRGPYLLWEHTHEFEEIDGGTLVRDHVRYRVPGGRLLNWLIVQRDLERIFSFRALTLQTVFSGSMSTHAPVHRDGERMSS